MKMTIANMTDQTHEFRYRLTEVLKFPERIVNIPPRSQMDLPDDLTKGQVDMIIEHHAPYGFISYADIGGRSASKQFTGLCYGLDLPRGIPGVKMAQQYQSNFQAKVEEGRKIRKEAAISTGIMMADTLDRETRNTELANRATVGGVLVEVEEMQTTNTLSENNTFDRTAVEGDVEVQGRKLKLGKARRNNDQ